MAKQKIDMRILFKKLGELRTSVGIDKWSFEHVEAIASKLGYTVSKKVEDNKEVIEIKEIGKKIGRPLNAVVSIVVDYVKKSGKSLDEVINELKQVLKK